MKNHNCATANFLIVGAMKAGTSSLANVLDQHPKIFIPKNELHFFNRDENYKKGYDFYNENFNKEIKKLDIQIAFESGFSPKKTIKFIDSLKKIGDYFFLNYDTGNSASFGFNPIEEFNLYNDLILNIHIKDRIFGGSTVPLGNGDTKFKTISKLIDKYHYKKGITLQVARAKNNNHKKVIIDSINFLRGVNIICD